MRMVSPSFQKPVVHSSGTTLCSAPFEKQYCRLRQYQPCPQFVLLSFPITVLGNLILLAGEKPFLTLFLKSYERMHCHVSHCGQTQKFTKFSSHCWITSFCSFYYAWKYRDSGFCLHLFVRLDIKCKPDCYVLGTKHLNTSWKWMEVSVKSSQR